MDLTRTEVENKENNFLLAFQALSALPHLTSPVLQESAQFHAHYASRSLRKSNLIGLVKFHGDQINPVSCYCTPRPTRWPLVYNLSCYSPPLPPPLFPPPPPPPSLLAPPLQVRPQEARPKAYSIPTSQSRNRTHVSPILPRRTISSITFFSPFPSSCPLPYSQGMNMNMISFASPTASSSSRLLSCFLFSHYV